MLWVLCVVCWWWLVWVLGVLCVLLGLGWGLPMLVGLFRLLGCIVFGLGVGLWLGVFGMVGVLGLWFLLSVFVRLLLSLFVVCCPLFRLC